MWCLEGRSGVFCGYFVFFLLVIDYGVYFVYFVFRVFGFYGLGYDLGWEVIV